MRILSFAAAFIALVSLPQVAASQLPTGTWKVNGNGFEGELVIRSVADGKVAGTIYGQPIVGTYDQKTKRLNFLRLQDPKDPRSFQAWKGYLFQNSSEKEITHTLAGTYQPFGEEGGAPMMEFGWFARISKAKE
jgi:hypothetical protein